MAHKQWEFERILIKFDLERRGLSPREVRHRLAILDAEEKMRNRFYLTKMILRPFRFLPPVRNLLASWQEYEEAYIQNINDAEPKPYLTLVPK